MDPLKIICWPDPRLKKVSQPVVRFDADLADLAARMFELMRAAPGVGLAAAQVGQNLRLFVMNPTGKPEDDRVYVNPDLSDAQGEVEAEEGCLSLPGLSVNVTRAEKITLHAQDLQGQPVTAAAEGYVARVWQHETDHLNGILLTDRMGPVAKLTSRKLLKELRDRYEEGS